jgi:RNA polymerase sigma-70 factor (ECF subfamily)
VLKTQDIKQAPEAIVISLAKGGNDTAFEELVNRHQGWVRSLMRRFSNNATLSDDLTQQVFLQCWRSLKSLKNTATFPAWLKRLVVTTWLQHIRKNDPLMGADDYEDTNPSISIDPTLAIDLDTALSQLSEPQRACVVLSYHENMTHEDIAEVTGFALGTIKSHIRRGTIKLKELLASYNNKNKSMEKEND